MTSRPVSSCGSSAWPGPPTTTGDSARSRRAAASSMTRSCSSRSSRSAPRPSSPPPTARRGCGWSCAARACGSGASGWSGSCGSTGLQGAHLRRGWKGGSTRQNPHHTAAPDLVERDFRASAPNRLWVADLTRILTGEGVVWLASVRDAFANRIVGWATDPRATTTLVLTALYPALRSRDVRAGQLVFHSDKGDQYTALRFTQRLVDAGVAPSTGSTGDSFDNALAENLWSTIKVELLYWPATAFATRVEAEHALIR